MFGITDLGTYLLGTIAIVLLPGPNSMFVLSVAARRGVRAGYAGAAGVFVGDAVLMLLTALGAASLLRAVPALFIVIKVVGAGYLTWVGLGLLHSPEIAALPPEGNGKKAAFERPFFTCTLLEVQYSHTGFLL